MDEILKGDALTILRKLPENYIDCCITSPPYYGLRDYGVGGQIGLEETPEEYITKLVDVFREVRRTLKDDGTLWVNIGDSYSGSGKGPAGNLCKRHDEQNMTNASIKQANVPDGCKPKDLIGIPWMLAFALRADGWYLRQDIIWHKPNPMPESVQDRCTKSHEYIFLLSKSQHYYFDNVAIQEPCAYPNDNRGARSDARRGTGMNSMSGKTGEYRNKRDVWSVNTKPNKEAHFATFPEELIEPCVLAGSSVGGIILDPFFGSGTTGIVATRNNRKYLGIELNPDYVKIAERRLESVQPKMLGIMEGA